MSLEKNPFLKPPSKPANKDTAGFIESVLGKKEGDAARKVIGDTTKQVAKPALEFTSIQLSPEEKARAAAFEKELPWTREHVIAWANKLGWDEAWVDKMFSFHADGSIEIEEDFPYGNDPEDVENEYDRTTRITELPAGIRAVDGDLDISESKITSLDRIPRQIRGTLKLNDTRIKSLEGLQDCQIGGSIYLLNSSLDSLEGIPPVIYGSLNLGNSNVSNLDALKSVVIGRNLVLMEIPALSMPAGVQVKEGIHVRGSQIALIESLRKNGYGDKLVIG